MIDGYKQLNNILIISKLINKFHTNNSIYISNLGTTNRLDMIDTALLRSSRFELAIKIGTFAMMLLL
jgi:ATP-dependent 26S proteasome regulatory subunit